MTHVQGHCPMGCGETLMLGSGGYVTCGFLPCPRPTAVSDILHDQETQHIVELEPKTFTIRHPLKERLDDALMDCALHDYLTVLDGPPAAPGRYRVTFNPDFGPPTWLWEHLDA
jgi:hypothetical protein